MMFARKATWSESFVRRSWNVPIEPSHWSAQTLFRCRFRKSGIS